MARSRFTHNSFATGFINKNIQGNSEFEQYNNALAKCTNFYVLPTGGVQKRAGTIYLSTLDYKKNKLIPYIVSRVENYMLVFSDKLLRIFTKYGEIDLGGSYTLDYAYYKSNNLIIYYNNDPNKSKTITYKFFPNTESSLITVGTYPMYYILYPTTNKGINDLSIYISTNLEDWNKITLIHNNTNNFIIYSFSVVGNTLSILLKDTLEGLKAQIAYIRGAPDLFDSVHLTDIFNAPSGYDIVRAAIVTHDDASNDYPIIFLKQSNTPYRFGISVSFSFSNITMLNLYSNDPYSEYPVFIANTTQKGIVLFFLAGNNPSNPATSYNVIIQVTESATSTVPSITIARYDLISDKYLHSSYIQYPDLTIAIGIKTTSNFFIKTETQEIKHSSTIETSNYIFPSFISDNKVGFILYARSSKKAYLYLTDNKSITFTLNTQYTALPDEKHISFNVNILRGMTTDFDESIIDSLKTFSIKNNLFIVCDKGIYSLSRLEATKFELKKLDEPFSIPPLTFLQETSVYLEATEDPASGTSDTEPKYILQPKSGDKSDPDKEYWPVFFNEDKNNLLVCLFNVESKLYTYYLNITKVEKVEGKEYNKIYASVDTALSPYKLTKSDNKEIKSWKLPDIEKLIENWQIGCMNEKRGWPTECELFEGRLFVANTKSYDLGLWASNLNYGDLLNFNVENNSASGLQKQVRIEQAGEILWLSAINKLFIGTLGGVCVVGSGTYQDEGLTPEKFVVRLFDALRPSALQPAKVKDAIFFVDQTGANVYEIVLDSSLGAYRANNISLLANELTKSGIISHTFLQSPVYSYWAALKNGRLAQMTYQKNNNVIAWSDHEIAGLHSRVISICALPNDDKDALWMVVSRTIKNKDLITLEYMPAPYDPIIQDSFKQIFSDSCVIQEHKRTIVDIDNSIDSTIFADFSFVKDVLKRNSCEALFMQEIKDLKRTYSMLGFKKGTNKLVLILLNDPIEQIDISDNHPLTAIYAAFKDNENIYIAGKNNQNKIGVAYSNNGGHSFVFNAIQFDNLIKNIYRFESIIVNNSNKLYLLTDYAIYLLNNRTTNAWTINSIINCFYLYDNKYAEIIHFDRNKNSISYIYQSTNNLITFNKFLQFSLIDLTRNNLCGVISFKKNKFLVLCYATGIIRYSLIGSKNAYVLWIEHTTQIPINSQSVYDFFMISNSIYLAYLSNENILKIAKLDIIESSDNHLYATNVRDNILINIFPNVKTVKFYKENTIYKIIATSNTKIYIASLRTPDQIILEKQYDITADLSDTTNVNMDTTPIYYKNFLLETVKLQLTIANNSRATIRNIISDDLDPQLLDIQKIKTQYPQIETMLYECGILCSTIVRITSTYIVCDASMLSTNDQILIAEDTRILPSLEIDSRTNKIIYKINRIVGNNIYLVNALDNTPIVLSNSANLDLEQTKLYIYKIITNKQKAEIRLGSDTRIVVADDSSLPKLYEGEEVYINTVWGISDINNKKYKINSITQKGEYSLEITLYDISQSNLENNTLAPLDTVNKGFYDSTIENNGNLYSYFDYVPIPHLIGEEVVIMADGNYVGSKIVGSSGVITLDNPAMYCVIGLQFTSSLQTVSFSGGSQIGSSIGGVTSQKDIILSLYNSLGGKYGTEITNMYPIPYPKKIELDKPAELFTGLKKLPVIKSKNIYERSTCIEHSEPVNFTLLALTEDTEVSDG